MPSSYSTSLRFNLQATGEGVNVWGSLLNTGALALVDTSVAGWTTKALTTDYTLTSANGTSDEARMAMLKFTGTGAFTVTVPAVSKRYDVWNATTGVLTLTNGSSSVTLQAGEVVAVITDGGAAFKRVQPTDFASAALTSVASITGLSLPVSNSQAASKLYVDNTAFAGMSGTFPGMAGNSGKVLTNDGVSTASWTTSLAGFSLSAPTMTGGLTLSGGAVVTGGLTLSGGAAVTGGQTLSGGMIFTGSTKQNVLSMLALDVDLSASDFFIKAISTNSTFTFSNATGAQAQAFALKLTISSAAVATWPAAVKWAGGAAPTLGNGTHLLGFVTLDGGTTWTGILAAFNYS